MSYRVVPEVVSWTCDICSNVALVERHKGWPEGWMQVAVQDMPTQPPMRHDVCPRCRATVLSQFPKPGYL